jgi:DNA-binding GntR family transcriptional regulator
MAYDPDATIDHDGMEVPYRQLAGILAARIERGDWEPGRPLPSVKMLRQEYGLARNTVQKTIALLEDRGLVVVVPQRGTYVKPAD